MDTTRVSSWTGHAWLALAARWYLASVFLLACYHKILEPAAFALDVATYQLLPLWAVNPTAITLPWIELATAILLLLGWRVRAAALVTAGMLVVFMVALLWALHEGLALSCGCFASSGLEADPISWLTLVRDAAWLVVAVYVLAMDGRPIGIERLWPQRRATGPTSPD